MEWVGLEWSGVRWSGVGWSGVGWGGVECGILTYFISIAVNLGLAGHGGPFQQAYIYGFVYRLHLYLLSVCIYLHENNKVIYDTLQMEQ